MTRRPLDKYGPVSSIPPVLEIVRLRDGMTPDRKRRGQGRLGVQRGSMPSVVLQGIPGQSIHILSTF